MSYRLVRRAEGPVNHGGLLALALAVALVVAMWGTVPTASYAYSRISQVGPATTFASGLGGAGSPKTALPAGTAAGDVLVSFVQTYAFASVTCKAGSREVLDVTGWSAARRTVARAGKASTTLTKVQATAAVTKAAAMATTVRLAACVKVAVPGEGPPTATVKPRAQVTMVTDAFSGVSTSDPVNASAWSGTLSAPAVTTTITGDELVYGEGSNAWRVVASAPSPARRSITAARSCSWARAFRSKSCASKTRFAPTSPSPTNRALPSS